MKKIKIFISILTHLFTLLILSFLTVILSLKFSGKYSYSYFSDPALAIFFVSIFLGIIVSIIGIVAYVLFIKKNKKAFKYASILTVLVSVLICILVTISYGLPAYGWKYNKEYSELLDRSGYRRSWDNRIYINDKSEFIGFGLKSPSYNTILNFIPVFVYEETAKGIIKDGILFSERENGEFWRIYPSNYVCRTKINEDHKVIAYDCAGGRQELAGCKEFILDDGSFAYPLSCKPLDLEDYNLKLGDNVVLLGSYGYPGGSHCEVCFEILEEVQTIDNYQLIIEKKTKNLLKKQERLADWKTYTNEEYKFEIKYPSGWEITTQDKYLVRIYTNDHIIAEDKCKQEELELIEKGIDFNPTGCRFGIFISRLSEEEIKKQYDSLTQYQPSLHSYHELFQLNRDYLPPDFAIAVVAVHSASGNDQFIVFEMYNIKTESQDIDVEKLLNQMLYTFKFIK